MYVHVYVYVYDYVYVYAFIYRYYIAYIQARPVHSYFGLEASSHKNGNCDEPCAARGRT